jgi:hypothetical protein
MYAMIPNFACGGILDQRKVLKSLESGPRVGQYLIGLKMISLQPQAYFCHRASSSPWVRETPSSKPLLL